MNPQNIKTAIEGKVLPEALKTIEDLLAENTEDANLLIARGKILWSMGKQWIVNISKQKNGIE